ncbi:fimbria/pilus outer membrane usher protein [Cypionkella psychrotolerans]|uniref:fimbria/pilus outer membrane usher protein n=1 Tax=Cypionkella psychrotolerans TaxID=1678131 RepID=UPI00138EF13F|nr:fimbria/pilus outer membrane usher protein [Cypionkella psychrotolerans]
MRRNFGLRSDLITQQLLSFDGAAAVPSSVDVFIDNNRAYSTGRDAGPFRLEDLPVRAGAGEALIVVTDANGRRTAKLVSFYVAHNLLKKGLLDFSIEAGRTRDGYGLDSNDYGTDGIFSGSLRYGLTERITLEAQVQTKSDLGLVGFGFTTVPFDLAEVSVAGGVSDYAGKTASFAYGALQTEICPMEISGSVRWAQKGFADLTYTTGVDYLGQTEIEDSASLLEVQSYHRNRVSVDLADLPADLALDASGMDVVPGIGSGVKVKFRGDTEDSAVIVLRGADGTPLEAGMIAVLNGGGEEFIVGFDGETLVQGLRRTNQLTVQSDTSTCTASFDFTAQPGALQKIEGVLCQ